MRNATLLLAAIALTACATPPVSTDAPSADTPSPSLAETPRPSLLPPPTGNGPIEPGVYTHRGARTAVPFTFTVPPGWHGQNGGRTLGKNIDELLEDEPREVSFNVYLITHIFTDACMGTEADRQEVGETADDLIQALMEQRNGAVMAEPIDITIDGNPATRVDLSVPPELDLTTCRPPGPVGIQIWQDVGGKYFVLLADGGASLYVADIGGERLVLTAAWWNGSSPDDIAEMEGIIESINIVE